MRLEAKEMNETFTERYMMGTVLSAKWSSQMKEPTSCLSVGDIVISYVSDVDVLY